MTGRADLIQEIRHIESKVRDVPHGIVERQMNLTFSS